MTVEESGRFGVINQALSEALVCTHARKFKKYLKTTKKKELPTYVQEDLLRKATDHGSKLYDVIREEVRIIITQGPFFIKDRLRALDTFVQDPGAKVLIAPTHNT
eukprot:GHVL01019045.1.p1 GENE.GHVL01019045.1~~GHVL01019045.1.p1  ORF type:complete len:105 (-),score=16.61 GHVL01019045.1:280-594(-)